MCTAKMTGASVDVSLGKSDRDKNKAAFDYLLSQRAQIEKELGITLEWCRLDDKKASYIYYLMDGVGIEDESSWIMMAKFHAEWSKKFYDVFVPLLQKWNAGQ